MEIEDRPSNIHVIEKEQNPSTENIPTFTTNISNQP